MFPSDMEAQGKKLMQMLAVAVNGLERLDQIVPAVQGLGKRHVGYGVKDAHYDTVGEAFIFTLGKGLGAGLTEDVRGAWLATYTLLADTMKAAAAEVDAPAAAPGPAPGPQSDASATPGVLFTAALVAVGVVLAAMAQ